MAQREFDSRKVAGAAALVGAGGPGMAMALGGGGAIAADAVSADAQLVDHALAFAAEAADSAALGFAAATPAAFVPDPVVQRTSSGAASVHLHQQYRGLTVFQMARAVRFAADGEVMDAVGTVADLPDVLDLEPKITASDAVVAAARYLAESGGGETEVDRFGEAASVPTIEVDGFQPDVITSFPLPSRATVLEKGPFENPIPAYLLIFDHPDGARLAWHAVLTFPDYQDQFVVIVAADVESAEMLYCKSTLHRAVARANVFEFSPGVGPRQMIDFPRPLTDYPAVPSATLAGFPADWVEERQTVGNSTRATLNLTTTSLSATAQSDPAEFNPANQSGDDQKLANIFYFCNYMHDFLYILGFDEAAGNFQQVNFTHTGLANDAVRARAHSGVVFGTANMATGPDGQPPVMNMGLVASTGRHTAFDSDVVFHEYAHGLSNRLVGGLMQGHALDEPQSSGMGEAWSDFIALTVLNYFRAEQGLPEKTAMGDWVTDSAGGIRTALYDDDYPLGYGDIGQMSDEHDVGEIWCAALMMAARRIRAILGDREGYRLAWTLVVDGLKLTPANPSFLQARDAILLALDQLGAAVPQSAEVRRALWESFAHFGMGADASSPDAGLDNVVADTSIPPGV